MDSESNLNRETEALDNPAVDSLPQGYRQGFLTANTVFLGFTLTFLRFWGFETGPWYSASVISGVIVGLSALLQLLALFRSLSVKDDKVAHYRITVGWFKCGVGLLVLGFVLSILVF